MFHLNALNGHFPGRDPCETISDTSIQSDPHRRQRQTAKMNKVRALARSGVV
jgi:hypothetical protein